MDKLFFDEGAYLQAKRQFELYVERETENPTRLQNNVAIYFPKPPKVIDYIKYKK